MTKYIIMETVSFANGKDETYRYPAVFESPDEAEEYRVLLQAGADRSAEDHSDQPETTYSVVQVPE